MLNLSCFVALLFLSLNHSISALSCYECQSTFPASSICLPPCTTRFVLDSTCVLMRNISLEPSDVGSLRAAHIGDVSTIPNITEKSFIFGEEAVYLNPSPTVGWDWEYGPITYGCDTNGCNEPGDVNRLPNALNARIPNATLERLLLGDLDNSCYVCNTCVDSDVTNTDMSNCTKQLCQSHACGFVATRNSPSSIAQCNAAWHYSSYCMGSREVAQVDMTLIYYIRSKSFYIYQMEAICLIIQVQLLLLDQLPALPLEDLQALPLEDLPALPSEDLPALPLEDLPALPLEGLPALPLEDLPALPPEDLPALPLEGLPALPLEDLPALPLEDLPALQSEDLPALPLEDLQALRLGHQRVVDLNKFLSIQNSLFS
ncbi:unnamed protein product [Rotaria magnacalcarata]